MTQFLVITGNEATIREAFGGNITSVNSDEFLRNHSKNFLAENELERSWSIDSAEALFTAASNIKAPVDVAATELGRSLLRLTSSVEQIAAWYASDSETLERVDTAELLLRRIAEQLLEPGSDVYLQFRRIAGP